MTTTLRIYFDGERTGPLFRRSVTRQGARVRAAARGAAQDAATEIDTLGTENVQAAGKFGPRWYPHTKVTEGGGNIRIATSVGTPLFWVFQKGMTIAGKPMLWIPFSGDQDTKGVWARDYPGGLFRVPKDPNEVTRKDGGAPLLLSLDTGEPKYFGKQSVTEPKKFRVIEIIREVAGRLKTFYSVRMKS